MPSPSPPPGRPALRQPFSTRAAFAYKPSPSGKFLQPRRGRQGLGAARAEGAQGREARRGAVPLSLEQGPQDRSYCFVVGVAPVPFSGGYTLCLKGFGAGGTSSRCFAEPGMLSVLFSLLVSLGRVRCPLHEPARVPPRVPKQRSGSAAAAPRPPPGTSGPGRCQQPCCRALRWWLPPVSPPVPGAAGPAEPPSPPPGCGV